MSPCATAAPAQMTLPRDVAAIPVARERAAAVVADRSCADAVRLLVTELVTNSVRYASGPQVRLRVAPTPDRVRVEVSDDGPGFTGPHTPDPVNGGGYGLVLVERLADDWGVCRHEQATTVWFEMPCSRQRRRGCRRDVASREWTPPRIR